MDKIEKIRAEIERHLNSAIEHQNANPDMPKHKWYLYEGAKELCTDLLGYLDDTFSEEFTSSEYDYARVDLSKFDDDIREYGEGFCEDMPKPYWDGVYEVLREMRKWGKLVKNIYEEPDKTLEEAALSYVKNKYNFSSELVYNNIGTDDFKAGAEWQREDMMKDAVEGEVIVPIYEGDDTWSAEIKIPGRYEIGNKVRIVVLKDNEDESK